MLTTIVCLVSLLSSATPQRLVFHFTPAQVDDLRAEYPRLSLQQAVCTHLSRAVEMQGEE